MCIRDSLEYNAACGGARRHRSLRSGRWRARSRAAGARQGHLHECSGAWVNSLGHQNSGTHLTVVPRASLRSLYARAMQGSEHSDAARSVGRAKATRIARWQAGPDARARQTGGATSSGSAVDPLRSHKSSCRALAARDLAHHRLERSDRWLRRPPRSTLDRSSAASDVYKRQVVAVDADRCAPAGAAHGLAQQALDRATCTIAAGREPTRSGTRTPALGCRWPLALRCARCTCGRSRVASAATWRGL